MSETFKGDDMRFESLIAAQLIGDGAGILLQLPDRFLRKVCSEASIELPAEKHQR